MRQLDDGSVLLKWIVIALDIVIFNLYQFSICQFMCEFCYNVQQDFNVSQMFYVSNISILVAEALHAPVIYKYTSTYYDVVIRTIRITFIQCVAFFILLLFNPNVSNALLMSVLFSTGLFVVFFILRSVEFLIIRKTRINLSNGKVSVFVGDLNTMDKIIKTIKNEIISNYYIAGYYSDDEFKSAPKWLKKLGSVSDFIHMAKTDNQHKFEVVYCTLSWKEKENINTILSYCDNTTTRMYLLPSDVENPDFNMKPEMLCGTMVFTNHEYPLDSLGNKLLKRSFDFVVSLFACIFILPIVPIVGLIIKIQSPGPIFFKQERTGLNGKTFKLIKFRSMHVNKDADTIQATKRDPRKFAFGNFMRKANVDELPQFFNVLLGNMSIVGPRPHMLKHTEMYSSLINRYMARHFVKPGITGWSQVTGYRGETKELWQMEGRVKRDCDYIKNWKFGFDIRIILMTIMQSIKRDKNAY